MVAVMILLFWSTYSAPVPLAAAVEGCVALGGPRGLKMTAAVLVTTLTPTMKVVGAMIR
eukprot:COSAG02_NODE_51639_length_313_cov_0.457944_1_plen_58_part_01